MLSLGWIPFKATTLQYSTVLHRLLHARTTEIRPEQNRRLSQYNPGCIRPGTSGLLSYTEAPGRIHEPRR